jgi:hypothetical protein
MPPLAQGEVLMFKLKRSIGWNFPTNDDGQENGLNDPGIETFKDHPLSSLAREVLQNSSDAADGSNKPVQVHFEKLEIPTSEFPGFADFKKTLQACAEYWKGSRSTEKFIKTALEVLARPNLSILKISDFNTTGLVVGSKGDRTSDWFKLTKSVGASDKHAGKLGSFGIGKHATYACSDLRTVFYGTRDNADATAVQGVAKLVSHKREGATTQGTGYFGVKNGNKPMLDFDSLPTLFERKKTGADVYIMGFHDFPDWEARIIKSVIESFFVAIHTGKLIAKVGKTTVNDTSLPKLIAKHYAEPDAHFLADEYYQALTGEGVVTHSEADFEGHGPIKLTLFEHKDFKKKVAMFRKSGMKIFDKRFQTPLRFAAVFTAEGGKLDALLRTLEPPSHNAWEPERGEDPAVSKKVLNDLFGWIREKVRQLVSTDSLQEVDPEGMSQYLPDELEDGEKGTPQKVEEINEEPAPVLDMRIRSAPPPSAPQYEPDKSSEEEEGEGEGEAAGGTGGGGETHEGGNGGGGGEGGGQDGTGTTGGGGGSTGADHNKRVDLTNIRIYCSDPSKGRYRLLFEPKTEDASHLRVFVIGEVGAEPAELASYSVNGGPEIELNSKGLIGPLTLKKGERAVLDVVLQDSLRCALGVTAYAN